MRKELCSIGRFFRTLLLYSLVSLIRSTTRLWHNSTAATMSYVCHLHAGMAELVDAADLKSASVIGVPVRLRLSAPICFSLLRCFMWFTVWKTTNLNTNERLIAFYKKELWSSHILDTAKKQQHYGTKWFRKSVQYKFPSARRYERLRAIVSSAYRKTKRKYTMLSDLGMKI